MRVTSTGTSTMRVTSTGTSTTRVTGTGNSTGTPTSLVTTISCLTSIGTSISRVTTISRTTSTGSSISRVTTTSLTTSNGTSTSRTTSTVTGTSTGTSTSRTTSTVTGTSTVTETSDVQAAIVAAAINEVAIIAMATRRNIKTSIQLSRTNSPHSRNRFFNGSEITALNMTPTIVTNAADHGSPSSRTLGIVNDTRNAGIKSMPMAKAWVAGPRILTFLLRRAIFSACDPIGAHRTATTRINGRGSSNRSKVRSSLANAPPQ
ncbi:MAG: hypothetical protein F4Y63_00040 [Chloroflexi bacterium]|nr:hypothetical protein [Chloroflexota bacterium]MYK62016.1 hypothetical protein [Chloroflexota bacterium]